MVDHISAKKRSYIMSRIRSKNTGLELTVRRLIFSMGYRYRLYGKDLPGKPDLVFFRRRKIIFVHGCFWHQHKECTMGGPPASNLIYWEPKLARTVERDKEHIETLQRNGWDVLVIWECEMKEPTKVEEKVRHFLGPAKYKNACLVDEYMRKGQEK